MEAAKCLLTFRNVINLNIQDGGANTPLHRAMRGGYFAVAKLLLDAGASATANNCDRVNLYNHPNYSAYLTWVQRNDTSINAQMLRHVAAGSIAKVQECLAGGADINCRNNTWNSALHLACHYGYTEMVTFLIKQPRINLDIQDDYGNTPLHRASRAGYINIVELLLKAHANPLAANKDGHTISIHAPSVAGPMMVEYARQGNLSGVQWCIERGGADVNHRTERSSESALHASASSGRSDIVEYLSSRSGANLNIQDRAGRSPATVARESGHSGLGDFFSQAARDREAQAFNHAINCSIEAGSARIHIETEWEDTGAIVGSGFQEVMEGLEEVLEVLHCGGAVSSVAGRVGAIVIEAHFVEIGRRLGNEAYQNVFGSCMQRTPNTTIGWRDIGTIALINLNPNQVEGSPENRQSGNFFDSSEFDHARNEMADHSYNEFTQNDRGSLDGGRNSSNSSSRNEMSDRSYNEFTQNDRGSLDGGRGLSGPSSRNEMSDRSYNEFTQSGRGSLDGRRGSSRESSSRESSSREGSSREGSSNSSSRGGSGSSRR